MSEVIGWIWFFDSQELLEFYSLDSFLCGVQDCFDFRGLNGWNYGVPDSNPCVEYEVYKVLCNNFCCDPLPFEEYAAQRHVQRPDGHK